MCLSKPKIIIKIQILICCPHMFSIEVVGRLSWSIKIRSVIMYPVLKTTQFCKKLKVQGEISCWSLSGLCATRAHWPLAPNFCSWATRKSHFFIQSYAGHPWFYSFRALGSLQFSLEHSLALTALTWVKTWNKRKI